VLAGCASAGTQGQPADSSLGGGGGGDSGNQMIDAGTTVDAPMMMIDAPPGPVTVTLSQTTNNTVVAANSVACGGCNNTSNPCNSTYTAENAYYRVFALADHGITTAFNVTQVTFGVQESTAVTVQVKLGTYAGTPGTTLNTGATDFAGAITQLATATVNVPATTTGISVPAPLTATVPAGSNLIVEILSPTHQGQANVYFYLGATNAGETKPGYLRAPSCSLATATTTGGIGYPAANLLISVTGMY
jgi:hypothetical protein